MRKASLLLAITVAIFAGACTPSLNPDVKSVGDPSLNASWEYTMVTIRQANDQYIQYRLNELGQDGWECFFVDKSVNGIHYLLKRSERE